MILNYLNQQIELQIPKTTKRLKKEIREELYNNYSMEKIPDESWKYKTPENMVDVKVNTKVNAAIINLFIFILYLLTIYKKTN